VTTFRHGVDAADQQLARDVDIGTVAQRPRHDRLDHRQNVLDPVIELVDQAVRRRSKRS